MAQAEGKSSTKTKKSTRVSRHEVLQNMAKNLRKLVRNQFGTPSRVTQNPLGKVLEPNYGRSGRMLHRRPERITTQYHPDKRKYVSVPASL